MDKLYISQNISYEITRYESINNNVLNFYCALQYNKCQL